MSTYLVALLDGGGTVPAELHAVAQLVERGHLVTVLAEDSMAAEVRASGATFVAWATAPNRADRRPASDPTRDWEVKSPPAMVDRLVDRMLVGPAGRYAADVRRAVGEQRPDAVLCSQFLLGAMVAAEAEGLPYCVLMPNVYLLPARGMPPFGMGLRPARGVLGRARDRVIGGLSQHLWDRKGLPGLNAVRAEHGLAPSGGFWDQIHLARRELVLTSRDFDFPADLPGNVRYVGPVLADPAWAEPWSPPPGEDPLVLVAFSSTFQDQAPTLQRVVAALATLPVRALVTTGPGLDPRVLSPPPNVTVVASAPHAEVLAHAALVVTHGGHGTIVKSLAADVPLVVIPHGRDQADNAARVAARGAGVTIKRAAKPAAIAAAVRAVLDNPDYRNQAQTLGRALRRDAASHDLIRELEALTDVPAMA